MATVLFVEDDNTILMGVTYSLRQEGFLVIPVSNLAQAREKQSEKFDMVLLDLGLPDGSGLTFCREIRSFGQTPIIILTAKDDEPSVVQGLDMGADDYIAKPFRLRELISRIRAVLRRRRPEAEPAILQIGNLKLDTQSVRVWKAGAELFLTPLEYRLLLTLLLHKGQTLTRARLLESIWDIGGDYVNDNTLTVYVKRLREKIENDPQNPRLLQTMRGMGYKLEEEHG